MGATFKVGDIPADLVDSATEWREKLLEQVAEMDDDVMEKYLDVSLIGLRAVVEMLTCHHIWISSLLLAWQGCIPTCTDTWQQVLKTWSWKQYPVNEVFTLNSLVCIAGGGA